MPIRTTDNIYLCGVKSNLPPLTSTCSVVRQFYKTNITGKDKKRKVTCSFITALVPFAERWIYIYDLKINKVSSDTKFDSLPYNPFKGRLSKIYFEFEYTRKNRNGMQESRIGRGEGYLTALYEYQNEKLELVSVVNYQLKTH